MSMVANHPDPICESILAQVLSFLPLDAATRFKSVCTSWDQLISSPYFRSLSKHHHHAEDHERVIGYYHGSTNYNVLMFEPLPWPLLSTRQDEYPRPPPSPEDALSACQLWATCDGLLVYIIDCLDQYYVRNPMTAKVVKVPAPPPPPKKPRLMYCGIANVTGNNNFEIVSISISTELTSSAGFIYSSLTGSWTELKIDDDEEIFQRLSSPWEPILRPNPLRARPYPDLNPVGAASLGRSLHWLFDDGIIFAFHLDERRWKVIKSPAVDKVRKADQELLSQGRAMIKRATWKGREQRKVLFRLKEHLYPNVWLGPVGAHLYLLLAVDDGVVQLWILEDYDGEEWKMIVEIKGCGRSTAPLFFDGRRIAVAPLQEWNYNKSLLKFFDTFNSKWQQTHHDIGNFSSRLRFFFPYACLPQG